MQYELLYMSGCLFAKALSTGSFSLTHLISVAISLFFFILVHLTPLWLLIFFHNIDQSCSSFSSFSSNFWTDGVNLHSVPTLKSRMSLMNCLVGPSINVFSQQSDTLEFGGSISIILSKFSKLPHSFASLSTLVFYLLLLCPFTLINSNSNSFTSSSSTILLFKS